MSHCKVEEIVVSSRAIPRNYEGLNLANQINWQLGVFDQTLEVSHFTLWCYFYRYQTK